MRYRDEQARRNPGDPGFFSFYLTYDEHMKSRTFYLLGKVVELEETGVVLIDLLPVDSQTHALIDLKQIRVFVLNRDELQHGDGSSAHIIEICIGSIPATEDDIVFGTLHPLPESFQSRKDLSQLSHS